MCVHSSFCVLFKYVADKQKQEAKSKRHDAHKRASHLQFHTLGSKRLVKVVERHFSTPAEVHFCEEYRVGICNSFSDDWI